MFIASIEWMHLKLGPVRTYLSAGCLGREIGFRRKPILTITIPHRSAARPQLAALGAGFAIRSFLAFKNIAVKSRVSTQWPGTSTVAPLYVATGSLASPSKGAPPGFFSSAASGV